LRLLLLALLGSAKPQGTVQECPEGYYRVDAIVFGCRRSTGIAQYLLAPAATTSVAHIPEGVTDFSIKATADTKIDLKLANPEGAHIVDGNSRRSGMISNSRRSGEYKGMPITISGNNASEPNTERLWMTGATPGPTVLRFTNEDSGWGTVTMQYDYDGIEPCPLVPEGCDLYDKEAAKLEVLAWSQWAQSTYPSADEAWLMRGAPYATSSIGGILWHNWPAVFAQSPVEPTPLAGEEWQPAFHYMDVDSNGEVSQEEFEAGFGVFTPRDTATSADVPEVTAGRNSSWILGLLVLLVAVLMGAAAMALCPPSMDRRKRGIRMVRSRDSDGQLETGGSDFSERGATGPPRKGPRSRGSDHAKESLAADCTEASAADSTVDSELQLPPSWLPRPLVPILGPFRTLPLPGGFWQSQGVVRYGPVPTAADDRMQGAPLLPGQGSPLLRPMDQQCQRSPSMAVDPNTFSVPASSSFPPVKVIQASPDSLESLRHAQKVHVVERSHSFNSAAGQNGAPSTLTVVEKVHSFSRVPGPEAAPGSPVMAQAPPGSPVMTQAYRPLLHEQNGRPLLHEAPRASVLAPADWARAAQAGAQQRTASPVRGPPDGPQDWARAAQAGAQQRTASPVRAPLDGQQAGLI